MHGVTASAPRHVHQFIEAKIAFARRGGTDRIRFVGEANVKRIAIHFAEDRDGFDAEFAAGADDAHGDFAAIGDENFAEHYSFEGLLVQTPSSLGLSSGKKLSTRRKRVGRHVSIACLIAWARVVEWWDDGAGASRRGEISEK